MTGPKIPVGINGIEDTESSVAYMSQILSIYISGGPIYYRISIT